MNETALYQQNYRLAPIIEAVIDIRVMPSNDMNFEKLDPTLRDQLLVEFPQVAKQFQNEFQFISCENPQVNPIASYSGLRFSSESRNEILQIKENGFTFSKLAPYDRWESFRDRAKSLWGIYLQAAHPQQILRIAVRFINRFDFPGNNVDIPEYLNVFPKLPGSRSIKGFSMQVVLDQPDLQSTLIITEAQMPPINPNTVSILLDFDLFNEEARDITIDFWPFLDHLRERKNQVFESAITDQTRRLIT